MVQCESGSVPHPAWLVKSAEAAFCAVSRHCDCSSPSDLSVHLEALPESRHRWFDVSTTKSSKSAWQVAEAQLAVLRHCRDGRQLLAVGPDGWRTWISVHPSSQLAGSAKVAAAVAAIGAAMDGTTDGHDSSQPAASPVQTAEEAAAAAAAELLAVSDGFSVSEADCSAGQCVLWQ